MPTRPDDPKPNPQDQASQAPYPPASLQPDAAQGDFIRVLTSLLDQVKRESRSVVPGEPSQAFKDAVESYLVTKSRLSRPPITASQRRQRGTFETVRPAAGTGAR